MSDDDGFHGKAHVAAIIAHQFDSADTTKGLRELVLMADNARLRDLIKSIEWDGCVGRDSDRACPFCGNEPDSALDHGTGTHETDCPAFSPDGKVK